MACSLVRIGSLLVLWQIASCEKTETAEVEANQSGQYNGEKNKKISQAEITQVGALDAAELNEDEKDEVEDAEKYAVEVTSHGDLGEEELTRASDQDRICCETQRVDSEKDPFVRHECMERRFCAKDKQLAEVVNAKELPARIRDCRGPMEQAGSGQDCQGDTQLGQQKAKKTKWDWYPAPSSRVCCGIRGVHVWRSGPVCLEYDQCKSRKTYGESKLNPGKFPHKHNHVVQLDGSKCAFPNGQWDCESR